MEHQISWAVTEVKQAIAELVKRDLMIARRAADGRVHYRANPQKLEEIRNLLRTGASKER